MPAAKKSSAKRAYHHGDLERALIDAALHTIREEGLGALTLRGVGERLSVSRTALYRHFRDKSDLLSRVALEGFRAFRECLLEAKTKGEPLEEMAVAYVKFATENPAHYRVMFGGFMKSSEPYVDLIQASTAAYLTLVEAIAEQQRAGKLRSDHSAEEIAPLIWSLVHGMATLSMDSMLRFTDVCDLARFAVRETMQGLARREPAVNGTGFAG